MADYDVAIIGGGPAGYAAALKSAEAGATVALIEAEKPGGACVHHACIPTNIMLNAVAAHLNARELAALNVFATGDAFNLSQAAARKDMLVRMIADGVRAALKMHKVTVISGRAAFKNPQSLEISGEDAPASLTAEAFVIATGTRWEPPSFPGIVPERVLTADEALALAAAPRSALVLGGGPGDSAFALEYATLLAAAGSAVILVTPGDALIPGLDETVSEAAEAALSDLGIEVHCGWSVESGDQASVRIVKDGQQALVEADILVAPDVRRPFFGSLNLARVGVETIDRIVVGRDCRTNVPHILAAGDVTGGLMLSNVATHMGEVAGTNAAGGNALTRTGMVPHLVHSASEIGWVGLTESAAVSQGFAVRSGVADLSQNPRAVALGARRGLLKVVLDKSLGEILGVHVAGPGASEIVSVAAAAMQAEIPAADVAAMVFWHPSMSESLVEATRRALL